MNEATRTATLMLVLLNPFLVVVYLADLVQRLPRGQFGTVLARAGVIASTVFCAFALLGDAVFADVLQSDFASFQIFGGVVFLLIALQFVFRGPGAIEILRGESEYVAGAVAMPVLIGPGTISASVLAGKRHEPLLACGILVAMVFVSLTIMYGLKWTHDVVRPRHERLVQRYMEVVGRIAALIIGTVSIDMIMKGVRTWAEKF